MPTSPPVSIELTRLFRVFGPAYQRWVGKAIPNSGMTPARMQILSYLVQHGPSPMRALRQHACSSATNITKLVDALEAEGMLVRSPSQRDRRVTLVTVSTKGKQTVSGAWEQFESRVAVLFEQLPHPAQVELKRSIEALTAFLQEEASR